MRLTWRQRLAVRLGDALQRLAPWHRLPRPLGLLCLIAIRIRLRLHNHYDPSPRRGPRGPKAGAAGFPFGRNQPLWAAGAETEDGSLLEPSPREVSERLLARDGPFVPVPFLNLLAAAWLQFQVHDWVVHEKEREPSRKIRVPLAARDDWPFGIAGAIPVARSKPSAVPPTPGGPPVYDNSDTHWWDGSQVYRMHPLIPDELTIVSSQDGGRLADRSLPELLGPAAQVVASQFRASDLVASFGVGRAGRIALHNYPDTLRNLARGAADVEPGDEPRIERVDLMVGLYAEPLPEGFGFSETAFRIFVLMASRRLKSDPAFTDLYGPRVYTREGLRWIEERTMQTVIAEHLPTLRPLMADVRNAFEPWDRPGNRRSGETGPFAPAEDAS